MPQGSKGGALIKVQRVDVAGVGRTRFLKITKTFELEAADDEGKPFRLRLPLDALHAMLYAAEDAESKGYLREEDMEREELAAIVPAGMEIIPVDDSGVMLTFELRSGKKVMFQLLSQASSETIHEAARLISRGVSLATASQRN